MSDQSWCLVISIYCSDESEMTCLGLARELLHLARKSENQHFLRLRIFFLFSLHFFHSTFSFLCSEWYFYVVGMSIEKLFDMWRNDEILKYYVICAAVSALSWLSQFCTSKNRFRENSKFRHFVTYQIMFLLTCQPHKLKVKLILNRIVISMSSFF